MCAAKKHFITCKKKKKRIVIVVMTMNSLLPFGDFPFAEKEKKDSEFKQEEEEA